MLQDELSFIDQHIRHFCCPRCNSELSLSESSLSCIACGQDYDLTGDLPELFWPNEWDEAKADVTSTMQAFYEETPFPNYDDLDDVGSLMAKARRGLFAKLLDDQVPFGAMVLECGCGTGQLTNFLSVANRTIIGTDVCLNSLRLAQRFKQSNGLSRAHFYQMNLFRPCFRQSTFDLVVSNGVLHHTSDPLLGFETIAKLVKPGGYLLIGLYHQYGRLATDLRRFVFNLTGDRLRFLDPRTVSKNISAAKRKAWFMDQYKNPHESKHTLGQVVGWIRRIGFTFMHSIPNSSPFARFDENELLFSPQRLGSRAERFLGSLKLILNGATEGGFFVVIARRPIT